VSNAGPASGPSPGTSREGTHGAGEAASGSGTSPATAGEVAHRAGKGGFAEGGCLCGAIRYRVPMPPIWVAHCHCSMCRRAQGAGFVTWFGVPGDRFSIVGTGDRLRIYRSSPDATRSFCGRCGTPLFFESSHWPGELHVTLASLDSQVAATLQPQVHSYWSSRAPWIQLADNLPRKDPPDHG
jgi:hypothetical protein